MTQTAYTLQLSSGRKVDFEFYLDSATLAEFNEGERLEVLSHLRTLYEGCPEALIRNELMELLYDHAAECPDARWLIRKGAADPWWVVRCTAYELSAGPLGEVAFLLQRYRSERHAVALGYCAWALSELGGDDVSRLARRSLPRTKNVRVASVWVRYLILNGEPAYERYVPEVFQRCTSWPDLLEVRRNLNGVAMTCDVEALYAQGLRGIERACPPGFPRVPMDIEAGLQLSHPLIFRSSSGIA